jgi:deoxycytidine triphosphate deaminase
MYLTKNEIKTIVKDGKEENFGEVSYDIVIDKIILPDNSKEESLYELSPGETVFVKSVEWLELPNNVIGKVSARNSALRQGYAVVTPVYLPGHKTKVFARVTNISGISLDLKEGLSISTIFFEETKEEVPSYAGQYIDEFKYKDLGSSAKFVDKKILSLENIESKIFAQVITIMTIFIGIFSLININTGDNNVETVALVVKNLVTLSGFSWLVTLETVVLKRKTSTVILLATLSAILLVITIGLAFVKK